VSDGVGEWYKMRRLKEMEEAQKRYEREATQTNLRASDEHVPRPTVNHSPPPVLEQLYNVLPPDTQDKIEWRFLTAFIGSILFWLGFALGRIQ
jgi:hypothetical protein